ncbi:hypothetical protein HOLleu_36490 [Holothuria leucospilota]|uniref:Uncharacterized protein n=1 Tax=Holothuria leucospilota TaxID=206669 RepID=A0A9Q1BDQ0_HOLLE|nr:hypothetical protein HOLleu_36490 [Holothuria leucospilota]
MTETLQKELDWNLKVLKEVREDRNAIGCELNQCQLAFAKESRALKEVISQRNQGVAVIKERVGNDEPTNAFSSPTSDGSVEAESLILAGTKYSLIKLIPTCV